jgi:phosphate transport system permease protein
MPGSETAAAVQLNQARPISERLIKYILFACGAISIATTAGIIFVLLFETIGFFRKVSIAQFFFDTEWTPLFADKHFGIWPLVAGTFLTSGIAIATAVPLGLLAALYLSEFAGVGLRRVLKPMLEILAGIPTVVYGYFALTMVTPFLQNLIPGLSGSNALGAGLVMGVMILPIIASLSEDSIYSVPANLREAAYALGATKLATTFQVVLPSAFSGIGAAVILGISRALGETMIVAIAAGNEPRLTLDPRVPIETMTAFIVKVSLGDTPSGTLEYQTIFAVGVLLFSFTFLLNIVAHRLRKRMAGGA